jgi:hypothetical protein
MTNWSRAGLLRRSDEKRELSAVSFQLSAFGGLATNRAADELPQIEICKKSLKRFISIQF